MSERRAERLLNLVLSLLSTRQYMTPDQIRQALPRQYPDPGRDGTDEAFKRAFERDKTELRELGIPIETSLVGTDEDSVGYRIARRDYELPEITLDPDAATAVALAMRLWSSPGLATAAEQAQRKLAAAGVAVSDLPVDPPRLDTADEAFGPELLSAVTQGRVIAFDYRSRSDDTPRRRSVEPWQVVSWRGRWYLVGQDRDRHARRVFRLSRIVGPVTATGRAGAVRVPDGVDPRAEVMRLTGPPEREYRLTVRIRPGAAQAVRRAAGPASAGTDDPAGWDVLEVGGEDMERTVAWVVQFAPDVEVLAPPAARAAAREHLAGVLAGYPAGVDR